jgi:hypothetical protein
MSDTEPNKTENQPELSLNDRKPRKEKKKSTKKSSSKSKSKSKKDKGSD